MLGLPGLLEKSSEEWLTIWTGNTDVGVVIEDEIILFRGWLDSRLELGMEERLETFGEAMVLVVINEVEVGIWEFCFKKALGCCIDLTWLGKQTRLELCIETFEAATCVDGNDEDETANWACGDRRKRQGSGDIRAWLVTWPGLELGMETVVETFGIVIAVAVIGEDETAMWVYCVGK